MRKITGVVAVFVVLSLILVLAPSVRADHLYATSKLPPGYPAGPNRIFLLGNCGGSLSYSANTGFFVAQGWLTFWEVASTVEKNAFMSPATKFELYIDGQLQKSTLHVFLVKHPVDFPTHVVKYKFFVSENNDGLSGTHTFEGKWYQSDGFFGGNRRVADLQIDCVVTVNFP